MGFLWGFMDEGKVFCQLFFPILQKECKKEYWPHNFGWSSWPTISIIISIIMPIFELSIRREWERHNGWFAKTTFARKSPCWAGMCIGLVYAIYTKYMYVYLYTARLYAYIYTYTYLFVQMYSLLPGQGTTYDATWGSVSSSSERTYRDIYIYIYGLESTVRLGIFQHARPFNCFSWLVDDGLLCLKPQNGGQFWADSSYWPLNQTTSLNWSPAVVLPIQPKLCKHHWNSPIIGMLPYAPPAKMPVTSESLARHSREKKNSCWLSGTGVAPPARHSCGNWGIDSCNWSVKVVYLDKGSPGLAVAGPIWYSARLEKTNKNTKPPRSTISFKVKHLKHWQRSQPSPLIQCLPGLWCWGASWSMAFLFTCSNFPSP